VLTFFRVLILKLSFLFARMGVARKLGYWRDFPGHVCRSSVCGVSLLRVFEKPPTVAAGGRVETKVLKKNA